RRRVFEIVRSVCREGEFVRVGSGREGDVSQEHRGRGDQELKIGGAGRDQHGGLGGERVVLTVVKARAPSPSAAQVLHPDRVLVVRVQAPQDEAAVLLEVGLRRG